MQQDQHLHALLSERPTLRTWKQVISCLELLRVTCHAQELLEHILELEDAMRSWRGIHRPSPAVWGELWREDPTWPGFRLLTHLELAGYEPTDELLGRLASCQVYDGLLSLSLRGALHITDVGLMYLSADTLPGLQALDVRALPGVTEQGLLHVRRAFGSRARVHGDSI